MITRGLALGLCLCAGLGGASSASGQTYGPPAATAASPTPSPVDGLHQALHLTPDQEVAWQAYRAEASAPTKAQERRRAAAQLFQTLNAAQRMDLVEAEMKQELVDLQRQSAALKAFYAKLNPDQQHTFDVQTLPPPNM